MATYNGTSGNDSQTGTTSSDLFYGGAGNDTMNALAGDDTVYGGDGNDVAYGGTGLDTLTGQAGNDLLDGGDGNDNLTGGQGFDTIYGGAQDDVIIGDGQWYSITASSGSTATNLTITNSADGPIDLWWVNLSGTLVYYSTIQPGQTYVQPTFVGHNWFLNDPNGFYLESITAGTNTSVTYGPDLADQLYGGDGNDTILAQYGNDTVFGGTGSDYIDGGYGDDNIDAGHGDDSVFGGDGNDLVYGGTDTGPVQRLTNGDFSSGTTGWTETGGGVFTGGGYLFDAGYVSGTLTHDAAITGLQTGPGTFGAAQIIFDVAWNDPALSWTSGITTVEVRINGVTYATIATPNGDGSQATITYSNGASGPVSTVAETSAYTGPTTTITINLPATVPDTGTLTFYTNAAGTDDVFISDFQVLVTDSSTPGNDTIDGGLGNDTLFGGGGTDSLLGGKGDDTIFGEGGDDIIYGDVGPALTGNRITNGDFSSGMDGWIVNNPSGNQPPREYGDGRASFNTNDETTYGDSIQQNFQANAGQQQTLTLDLFENGNSAGNHTFRIDILGANGAVIATTTQTVNNGATLPVSLTFTPTTTNNTLVITNTTSTASSSTDGQVDNVVIQPSGSLPADFFGSGNDSIDGGAGNDTIFGGAGNDTLSGGDGDDTIDGGTGDDYLAAGAGTDSLSGGDGADTLFSIGGGADTLSGGADGDTFDLRDLSGQTITGGETTTTGTDTDRLTLQFTSTPVTVTFTGNEAGTISDGANSASFSEIEQLVLGDGNDTIYGGTISSATSVNGGGGDDWINFENASGGHTIEGAEGADSLFGATGDDLVYGGSGNDLIAGNAGNDTLNAGGGDDVVLGDAGNDSIDGGEGNDLLYGDDGADTIFGGDGADTISGGTGNDMLVGGGDADTFYVMAGEGDDTVQGGETGTDNDTLILNYADVESITYGGGNNEAGAVTFTAASGGGTLTFSEIENIQYTGVVDGTSGNDSIGLGYVDAQGDELDGSDGNNDTVLAGDGDDVVEGLLGNDSLDGGAGTDTAVYTGAVTDYSFDYDPSGALIVTDLTAGRDGTDTI
jgi:Ca2+-binding RTX toxin-like protein